MPPAILALDFDGVICDGLIEYFQTAWQAYRQVWQVADQEPPSGLAESFYRLRPVVETGWEMPVVLRALATGISEADILQDWPTLVRSLMAAEQRQPSELAIAVDGYRDRWIQNDLPHWLAQHRFYPGILEQLQMVLASPTQVVVITTKEGRFVRQLLGQQGITLADDCIFGKETQRPKFETLQQLLAKNPQASLWFIEDRLKTLLGIKPHPSLNLVRLFLADWGYNTPADRQAAEADDRIQRLSLATFCQALATW